MARHKSQVRDWMTRDPETIGPNATLMEAYSLMSERDVRRLPVLDSDRTLVGIITASDIRRAAAGNAQGPDEVALMERKVSEVMASDPEAVEPDDTIQDAAELMIDAQVSGLPVVDGDRLVGIITESDIFRVVVSSWGEG